MRVITCEYFVRLFPAEVLCLQELVLETSKVPSELF